jgi:hypothetical protein
MAWVLIVFGLLLLIPAYAVDGWPRIYLAVLAFFRAREADGSTLVDARRRCELQPPPTRIHGFDLPSCHPGRTDRT